MPQRPTARRLTGALEPEVVAFARGVIGRSHQSRDDEPSGPAELEVAERAPDPIVERSLDVT